MHTDLTWRQKVALAALAADPGAKLAPVQVQKLFFLIDENVAVGIGGRQFNFEPYDYGPFDKAVYEELDSLQQLGFVEVINAHLRGGRRYTLTLNGQSAGEVTLNGMPKESSAYLRKVAAWVRSLSFSELVGSIYKAYPAMKANSIFRS